MQSSLKDMSTSALAGIGVKTCDTDITCSLYHLARLDCPFSRYPSESYYPRVAPQVKLQFVKELKVCLFLCMHFSLCRVLTAEIFLVKISYVVYIHNNVVCTVILLSMPRLSVSPPPFFFLLLLYYYFFNSFFFLQ